MHKYCSFTVTHSFIDHVKFIFLNFDPPHKLDSNFTDILYIKGKVHPCTGTEALYRSYGP